MFQLIAGAVVGASAVWYWGDDLRRYSNSRARAVGARAADALQTVQKKVDSMIDTAKERVDSALEAGQGAIRPHSS